MIKDETFFKYPEFTNIKDVIYYSVEKNRERKAFIIKHKNEDKIEYENISYGEFLDEINKLGTGLYKLNLQGKRIGIIAKNRYEWVLTFVACMCGGMIAVPLDKALTDVEIENSIMRSKIDAIVFEENYANIMQNIKEKGKYNIKEFICMDSIENFKYIKDVIIEGQNSLNSGNKEFIDCKIEDKALAEIVFTSGTSANSKIVMLSQYNLAQNISAMQLVENFEPTDVAISLLPYHHTFGSTGELINLSTGICTVYADGLRYIGQNLKEYHVTFFVGVPALVEAIYKKLMAEIEKKGMMNKFKTGLKISRFLMKLHIDLRRKIFKDVIENLGGLRFVISGAAALDKKVEELFNDIGILTVQGYGLTEASPVLVAENYKYRRYGSIGLPMPNVEVKLVNTDENGVGELYAKGPNVMIGYMDDEEKTKETLIDGWLNTGDLATIDKDGFVYICGRKKDMIVLKNGKKIFPDELEALVNKIDLVEECMVFGLPKDDDISMAVKVKYNQNVVKTNYNNLTEDELNKELWNKIKRVNKLIPKYKYMKHLYIEKNDFIKTTTNKIKRFEEMKKIKNEKEVEKI